MAQAPITEDDWTSDWTKVGTWDQWVAYDRKHKLVKTLPDMAYLLDVHLSPRQEQVRAFRKFLTLPSSRPMPKPLRADLEAFLAGEA